MSSPQHTHKKPKILKKNQGLNLEQNSPGMHCSKQAIRRQKSNRLFIFTGGPIYTSDLCLRQQESCGKIYVTTSLKTVIICPRKWDADCIENLNSGFSDF